MIKLALFDIDGTLYDEKRKEFTRSALEALRRLIKNGIIVAVATGRTPRNSLALKQAGVDPEYLICCNGHLVVDRRGDCIINEAFSANLAQDVYDYCKQKGIGLLWKYPDKTYIYINNPGFDMLFSKYKNTGKPDFLDFENKVRHLLSGPNGGCLACDREKLRMFNRDFEGRCYAVDINGYLSDLLLWNVSKKTGLEKLLSRLSLSPNECMAFGDNLNDLELIQYVGIGVAMGNSPEKLKKYSDYVTSDIAEDGIKKALLHFKLI